MPPILSFCGLDCSECPAYKALRKDDPAARAKAAAEWSKLYNADIKPDDVFCNGCTAAGGRHFGHCSECEYRACGQKRKVENCGCCDEYPCAKISKFFEWVPASKVVLDAEREKANAKGFGKKSTPKKAAPGKDAKKTSARKR